MKTIRKLLPCILLVCMLATAFVMPCAAQAPINTTEIQLNNNDEEPINGLTVYFCKIADRKGDDFSFIPSLEGALPFTATDLLHAPSSENALLVYDCVKAKGTAALSAVSAEGIVSFSTEEEGVWLVYCQNDSLYTFDPYFVFLPYAENWEWQHKLISKPNMKIDTAAVTQITVSQQWDDADDEKGKRPDSVVVELKRDGMVIQTATLSKQSGWTHTFTDLSGGGYYSVGMQKVAQYTARYNGDCVKGFVVTGIFAGNGLPQTGEDWRPVLILIVVGVACLLFGILKMRGKRREEV